MYGALGTGSVKNVRRKISSTDYTIKYYPDPDDSSKRQKVVEEETKDIELTMEELKMAFRWVGGKFHTWGSPLHLQTFKTRKIKIKFCLKCIPSHFKPFWTRFFSTF